MAGRLASLLAALPLACTSVQAQQSSPFKPSAVYVQLATANATDTHAATVGLTWDWSRTWRLGAGEITGYWDASLSRWSYASPGGRDTAWLLQAGIKPVFRWTPDDARWFVEGGIGASVTTSVYQTNGKQFSTTFNFGDHLALGATFGAHGEHEISLRIEHFSNAGIRHPNPGENFVQIRYLTRL